MIDLSSFLQRALSVPYQSMLNARESPERDLAFTDEGLANIIGFLECVRDIVDDLMAKGYTIEDGKLIPPPPDHR